MKKNKNNNTTQTRLIDGIIYQFWTHWLTNVRSIYNIWRKISKKKKIKNKKWTQWRSFNTKTQPNRPEMCDYNGTSYQMVLSSPYHDYHHITIMLITHDNDHLRIAVDQYNVQSDWHVYVQVLKAINILYDFSSPDLQLNISTNNNNNDHK